MKRWSNTAVRTDLKRKLIVAQHGRAGSPRVELPMVSVQGEGALTWMSRHMDHPEADRRSCAGLEDWCGRITATVGTGGVRMPAENTGLARFSAETNSIKLFQISNGCTR